MLAAQTVCLHGVSFLPGWGDDHADFLALDARLDADHLARRIDRLVRLLDLEHEEGLEKLQERMQTEEAKALYKKRKQTVELAFADQKEHRGLRKFRSRGKQRAECQVGLLVLAHNGLIVEAAVAGEATPATGPPGRIEARRSLRAVPAT